ncbi:hypothetical protein SAMN04488029_2632 [Reichenbachiella faecimaris]|uniref:Calx-beta domain-containing protein n=1 Tax=Reichenbachiella faecimaris TaxID=692418 RepID=A0A1W2GHE9_REIFA|nr:hypothetical protein [Reichenbachiella faecimaris]SMD35964.1 hypothetical protein SAMN04488029_2632 [Reichenbachiella faecimaris]
MKNLYKKFFRTVLAVMLPVMVLTSSCEDESDLEITNDLRVLLVKANGENITTGVVGVANENVVIEITFSHALDQVSFEAALSISGSPTYTLSYDETGSFASLSFPALDYETSYTLDLPIGTYGAGDEALDKAFNLTFTTKEFVPPTLTLSSEETILTEGLAAMVTATISEAISVDVTLDLTFSGTATKDSDYTANLESLTIAAGSTSAAAELTIESDAISEGEETIIIIAVSVNNAIYDENDVTISLFDLLPKMELKGVMELDNYINGTDGRVRAIHILVTEDIANLGEYGIEIAANGAAPDPADIDFTFTDLTSASAGEHLLIVRTDDEANASAYFESSYADFTVITSDAITQNGDDAILLYQNGVSVESFGDPGVDGTGEAWEYTDSWAYKLADEWIYGGVGCVEFATGTGVVSTSECIYPFSSEGIEFRGIMSLSMAAGNGRAYHFRAQKDIDDLSQFGVGIAANGQETSDGVEYNFPAQSASEGEHILLYRDSDESRLTDYFGSCFASFEHAIPSDFVTSNGNDVIELFSGTTLIETYGVLGVNGEGEPWEYTGSWASKVNATWTYAGVDCTRDAIDNATSGCSYTLCD